MHKIWYNKMTDTLEIYLETGVDHYVDDYENETYEVIRAENDNRIIGYIFYNALKKEK